MPPWKEEIRGFWNRYIREHCANDIHHLVLNLAIWKSLDSRGKIALFRKNQFCNFEVNFWEDTHSYSYEDYS